MSDTNIVTKNVHCERHGKHTGYSYKCPTCNYQSPFWQMTQAEAETKLAYHEESHCGGPVLVEVPE